MRALLLILCLGFVSVVHAGARADSYFVERDAAIAKFSAIDTAGKFDDKTLGDMNAALASLEKTLEAMIGRDHFAGLSSAPKIHLDTLVKSDEGFGLLDGLDYASPDHKTVVTVTTTALLRHWLVEHKNWWGKGEDISQALDQALRSEGFYTQAISTDAAFVTYAEIPLAKPADSADAVAFLAATTQSEAPRLPGKIILSVVGAERSFVVVVPLRVKIAPIAACSAIWDDAQTKIAALDQTADPKIANVGEEASKLRKAADQAYRRCFAEKATTAAFFPAVIREAQQLLGTLPLQSPAKR